MLFPPFRRGRVKNGLAGNRTARFRSVLLAAARIEDYHVALAEAGLDTAPAIRKVRDVEETLRRISLTPFARYARMFGGKLPAPSLRKPERGETRTAIVLSYRDAKQGLANLQSVAAMPAIYSPVGAAAATHDLYRLAKAIQAAPKPEWLIEHAVVAFSGVEAGILTQDHRNLLWETYEAPLFEQFLGVNGEVVAAECEIHAGLHVRTESAVIEIVNDELVLTSLTDEVCPTLRVRTGLSATMESAPCECGKAEPRLTDLRDLVAPEAVTAVA